MSIEPVYAAVCGETSDIFQHLPRLRQEVVDRDAKVIVELGVRSARSTVALLAGAEVTGGVVWSVDIADPYPPEEILGHPSWVFVRGNDLELVVEAPEPIDVLFIDTSHTYDQTLAELDVYGPKVRAGGVILLHDIELEHPDAEPTDIAFPVEKAVLAWLEDKPQHGYEHVTGCYGLGVITIGAGNGNA
jgi:cephalosporin hydroxylase